MTAALEGGEWSAVRPGRTLPPGKTLYPFYRRLGGSQGRSRWAENLVPTWDSIPECPARSQSLSYYSAHITGTISGFYAGRFTVQNGMLSTKIADKMQGFPRKTSRIRKDR